MKSLIILRGIDKIQKKNWVEKENLSIFYVDIDIIERMYSTPEFTEKYGAVLGRLNSSNVYIKYLEVIKYRLSNGCLVVVDANDSKTSAIEELGLIYGYTVFNVITPIPQDYTSSPRKYSKDFFKRKTKEELENDVKKYLDSQIKDSTVVNSYSDIEKYWKDNCSKYSLVIPKGESIYFVSDLHSNYTLLESLFNNSSFDITKRRVFLGDYIDGPEVNGSRKLINFLLDEWPDTSIFLEGNHERRLREYLYCKWRGSQKSSYTRKGIVDMIFNGIPEDFLKTTAKEFENLSSTECHNLLIRLNAKLQTHIYIYDENYGEEYICTHSGISSLNQISPKYIGNAIYGTRDMDEYDREFTNLTKKSPFNKIYSVHAHCKYPDGVDFLKYERVINLDPEDESKIVYLETKKPFKPCVL